ncbi:MAG TPA: mechanosensitive ion channel family protein [Alphaproteobacteria bacterium]|nr:mechanosensitive ion channel family protein [Alphaproteobacteria bacterium]
MEPKNNTIKSGLDLARSTIEGWVESFYGLSPNLIVGLVFLLIAWAIGYGLRRFVTTYFNRRNRIDLGKILAGFSFWAIFFLGFLIALTIILPSLRPADLLASFGIGSLALGFAFKEILQNWMAGLLILLRLPFRRGDQISINGAEGTVQRIEPRATIIQTYDGRDIVIPNTTVYTSMVIVHTSRKTRRIEIDFTVGYAYEFRRIRSIIENSLSDIEEVMKDPIPQIMCWNLGDTSLGIKVRWWIRSDKTHEIVSRARVVQAIKEGFDANDIDPTDPQLILYQQVNNSSLQKKTHDKQIKGALNGAPSEVHVPSNDPESEKMKRDARAETMLPDTDGAMHT